MPITHKQIAEIAGVSRGTVDRALNNRGRVKHEVQQKIKDVAAQHGYIPNHAGKALAKAKTPVKIGAVMRLSNLPFFKQVVSGLYKAGSEIVGIGGELIVAEIPSNDIEAQIKETDSLLKNGINGLCISPTDDNELREYLSGVQKNGVTVVTFNTDTPGIGRMCYVGLDNLQSGRAAAGLMHMLLAGRQGKILIISGNATTLTNYKRVDGFIQEVSEHYRELEISSIQFNMDEEGRAEQITISALESMKDLAGIYMVSAGQAGMCRALENSGYFSQVKVIVHDILPETVEYIKKGGIDFIIDQNAFEQGYRSVQILFKYLFNGEKPDREQYFTDISIKTMHNL